MTCIVGYKQNGKVYLGGDSAATQDHAVSQYANPKVFKNGPYVFGFTDSFRMGQILQYVFKPPKPTKLEEKDVHRFMVSKFIPAIRLTMIAEGFASVEDNVETGGTFIVGYKGRLFEIHDDYQVAEKLIPYTAIGCGDDFSTGAFHALEGIKIDPKERLEKALDAAATHSGWVTGPYHYVNT